MTADSSDDALMRIVGEIACMEVEPDGLQFDDHGISISEIREAQDYPDKRIKLPARLGHARLNLQIDVGFGDAVTPAPTEIDYPVLLDLPSPWVKAYPYETVIAEKLQTLVVFDMAISRMKDFYDIWMLSKQFAFDAASLSRAIAVTFERCGTAIPKGVPTALTDEFAADRNRQMQWAAFLKRYGLANAPETLSSVVRDLRAFLLEPIRATVRKRARPKSWKLGGPWL